MLEAIRSELIDPQIAADHGRIVKTTGDGLLVEFGSTGDALRCASAVQAQMAERNAVVPESRIEWRIGIHQGDIVAEDGDIFGDGFNICRSPRRLGAAGRRVRFGARAGGCRRVRPANLNRNGCTIP
jgi:adenylate cyclase